MAEREIDVIVACSPAPREVLEWPLRLPQGATVADALGASGVARAMPGFEAQSAAVSVWGRAASGLEQVLHAGDRVEVLRPLKVDPKVARRERFRKQGSRGTGLFANRRAGAKPGY